MENLQIYKYIVPSICYDLDVLIVCEQYRKHRSTYQSIDCTIRSFVVKSSKKHLLYGRYIWSETWKKKNLLTEIWMQTRIHIFVQKT